MVRGGAYGIPLVRRAPTRPRRKLAIALNKLGAELLFPAIPDIKPGWRILSGFFVMLFGMGIIISFSTPEFGINQVEVYGLQRLSVADLESTFRFRDLRVFSAAPEKITSDVEDAFPELKEVRVKVTLPDKLVINVVERQPIVAWKYTDMLIWIDSEGVLFPARGEAGSLLNIQAEEAPPLLSLEPPSQIVSVEEAPINLGEQIAQPSQRLVDPVLLNTALTLSQQIPADTTLVFNDRNGMGWKDPSGWDVFVGRNLTNLDQKLIVYQGVKEYLGKQGIRPKLISVEHIHAPYYRVE
jgi:cell division protein FtsQ